MVDLKDYKNNIISSEYFNKVLIDNTLSAFIGYLTHIKDYRFVDNEYPNSIMRKVEFTKEFFKLRNGDARVVVTAINSYENASLSGFMDYNSDDIIMIVMSKLGYIYRELELD